MIGLRLFEFLRIEGRAAHVIENGADAINRGEIIRVDVEHLLVLVNRLISHAHVFFRGSARDVLRRVSGGQIKPRVQEARIELLRLLKVFDGLIELAALVRLNALVE